MISEETREKWKERIGFCTEHSRCLNEWELSFMDSVDEWLSSGKDLTFKQSKVVNRIFHRVEEEVG